MKAVLVILRVNFAAPHLQGIKASWESGGIRGERAPKFGG